MIHLDMSASTNKHKLARGGYHQDIRFDNNQNIKTKVMLEPSLLKMNLLVSTCEFSSFMLTLIAVSSRVSTGAK